VLFPECFVENEETDQEKNEDKIEDKVYQEDVHLRCHKYESGCYACKYETNDIAEHQYGCCRSDTNQHEP
jgi:hypothetical protein